MLEKPTLASSPVTCRYALTWHVSDVTQLAPASVLLGWASHPLRKWRNMRPWKGKKIDISKLKPIFNTRKSSDLHQLLNFIYGTYILLPGSGKAAAFNVTPGKLSRKHSLESMKSDKFLIETKNDWNYVNAIKWMEVSSRLILRKSQQSWENFKLNRLVALEFRRFVILERSLSFDLQMILSMKWRLRGREDEWYCLWSKDYEDGRMNETVHEVNTTRTGGWMILSMK